MTYYRSVRLINGKPKCVIVDENAKIVNKEPSNEELKNLEVEKRNNLSGTCNICEIKFELAKGHPLREYDKKEHMKNVERVYIFPWKEVITRAGIILLGFHGIRTDRGSYNGTDKTYRERRRQIIPMLPTLEDPD